MKNTMLIPVTAILLGQSSGDPSLRGLRHLEACPIGAIFEEVVIDFETDLEGYPLESGDYLSYLKCGVSLTCEGNGGSGYTEDGPRLFDTANPTNDEDLGSPNKRCDPPGPGVGEGGEPDSDGKNCEPLGNVLIIQESNKPTPDDNWRGGTIAIHFDPPVPSVTGIGLMDLEEDENPAKVFLTSQDGSTSVEKVYGFGDNSYVQHPLESNDVTDLKVKFKRSGAVADVTIMKCLADCACKERQEELALEIAALKEQIVALKQLSDWLWGHHKTLQAASDKVLGTGDNYVLKVASRCFIGGLEAYAVGKVATALKAATCEAGFALNCLRVGLKGKEVVHYLWSQKKLLKDLVVGVSIETAAVIAKTQVGDQGWVRYIPIVGSVCEAHDWSGRVLNSADLIEEIGRQQLIVLGKVHTVEDMVKEKEKKKAAKEQELKDLIDACPNIE